MPEIKGHYQGLCQGLGVGQGPEVGLETHQEEAGRIKIGAGTENHHFRQGPGQELDPDQEVGQGPR